MQDKQWKNKENQQKPMENKGKVRKMKENQWKTEGTSQTEKKIKIQNQIFVAHCDVCMSS